MMTTHKLIFPTENLLLSSSLAYPIAFYFFTLECFT